MIYSFAQWLFFFYIYCFIGWIWETCYVSVLQGKWVNRGFMRGPFLPIYGSGAIIVLIFTLPVRTDAVAVFFIGMISATILEYCTGVMMEKLFHVRYWDYSNQPLNLKGHICVTSSLAWGVFSVVLTLYGHTPLEHFVLGMNRNALEFLVFILTVIISIDMFESVREAMNLKEMLLSLEENNAEFRRIQKHIEVVQAFYGTEIKEKSEVGLKKLSTAIENGKEFYNKYGVHKKRKSVTKEVFISNLERARAVKEETLKRLNDTMEAYAEKIKSVEEKNDSVLQAISESRNIVSKQKHNIFNMKNKEYVRLRALLKRNPHAISKMHEQAFSELMDITQEEAQEEHEREKLRRLGELLEESVANQEIAGGNLCVIHNGQELYYAQAGYSDIANKRKMERDSIVRLYSMTKPITASAVMLLVERGIVDLLDPLEKYFPEFSNTMVTADRKADIGAIKAKRSITIRDCMNMTSGLPYGCDADPSSRDVGKVFDELDQRLYSQNPMTTVELAKRLGSCRLDFQPGEGWRYGTSADVLGAVVEVASGMHFGEFLEKEFFRPLGMKDTGFRVSDDKRDRLTVVYESTPDGLIEYHGNHLGICNHMDTKIAFESGGAGLVSTLEDYRRFTQMLMQKGSYEGNEILAPKTVEYMTNCHLQPNQQIMMKDWENLYGFSYGNLMRVLVDPSLTVFNGSVGEYGWDGWLGPYFANMPKEDTTFLMMVQRKDSGTFTLTRKLRNALAAAME